MAKDLLLEIGTEEIPAKFMTTALTQLKQLAENGFKEQRLTYEEIRTVGTPRRLTLFVQGLAECQTDQMIEAKGPSRKVAFDPQGKPTKAVEGFARGQGVAVEDLVVRETSAGEYVYAVRNEIGKNAEAILPSLLASFVTGLSFAKAMRWGELDIRFVRPIRWLVALFDSQLVEFDISGIRTGRTSMGHRFLSQGAVEIDHASNYFTTMDNSYVMVDPAHRESAIRRQVEELAVQHGGTAEIDLDLLEEVVHLVEYPTALCGQFEDKYLELPKEAVITPMREHQRYFPVLDKYGKLLPLFITVRNGGAYHLDTVKAGNERVLRARLADAKFFYEEDKKERLSQRVEKLKSVVFQEGLGTLYDKTLRLQNLSAYIANELTNEQPSLSVLERASFLSKADLLTSMVREFTELQGIMGREYALLDGESQEVGSAIYEHYLPRFAGDVLPETTAGTIVSMADKIDNIVATFSRGLIPTGSQDPFALRRQALGITLMIIEGQRHISLGGLIRQAMNLLNVPVEKRDKLSTDIEEFFRLRLRNVLAERGVRYDVLEAVLGSQAGDLYQLYQKAMVLQQVDVSKLTETLQGLTRVANLAKNADSETVDAALLCEESEHELWQAYLDAAHQVKGANEQSDYAAVVTAFASLHIPIHNFFDKVMVMSEDLQVRRNRLAILRSIHNLMLDFADLTKIVIA